MISSNIVSINLLLKVTTQCIRQYRLVNLKKKKKEVKLVPDVPGTRTSYIDTYDYTS